MVKQSLLQWTEDGEKLFGTDKKEWKFKCPACGKISAVKDFKEYTDDPNDAIQMCIGRVNGKGSSDQTDRGHGCNWAAFGLFGTLDGGRVVYVEGEKEVSVFDFAQPEEEI